jgi:hypothetical protein
MLTQDRPLGRHLAEHTGRVVAGDVGSRFRVDDIGYRHRRMARAARALDAVAYRNETRPEGDGLRFRLILVQPRAEERHQVIHPLIVSPRRPIVAASSTVRALPGRYAKFLTAVAGNALVYADVTYGTTNRWVELATAAAVALGVLAVPNTPKAAVQVTLPAIKAPSATEIGREVLAAIRKQGMTATTAPPEPPAATGPGA